MIIKEDFSLEQVSIRLVKDGAIFSENKICEPMDAVVLLGKYLSDLDREVVCVINLKTDGTPINFSIVSMGALNEAVVHPREMLKSSILSNAASMIMLHNHPSGNLQPSKEDSMITDRMIQVCDLIGIPLLDHIIVGSRNDGRYFSFKQKGMTEHKIRYETNYENLVFSKAKVAERKQSEIKNKNNVCPPRLKINKSVPKSPKL